MNNVVSTKGLTKHYGRIKAVENLTFSIPENAVFGILGPNGSGKTTTLGMLLDVIQPTSGTYSWFEKSADKQNLQKIGSILETPAFYPYLSAMDNLKIIANIKNCGYAGIDESLKITGIWERRYSAFSTYSLGMKQRLALAAALISDPRVLILDEPTNGLDPGGIAEIRELIRIIAAKGKTIILASHLLDEVQKVCTHFAVLKKGQLMHSGPVNEVRDEQYIEISANTNELLSEVLQRFPAVMKTEKKDEMIVVTMPANVPVDQLSRYIFEQGISITHFVSRRKSLEAQFLEILNEHA